MTAAVRFENVSKKFLLHHQKARSFQEALVNLVRRNNGSVEEFWALRNVSFEVQPGETLGIVGENGSGKSTALKLITQIVQPTSGRVCVDGKVSALIELGAGFHPDLTGRENIFLYGSILGLSRKEMQRRFDEIVSFAELERFVDTPVKHYSSGMYMRLGFAVAINVDPDILIIDEVLSVGDEVFQRKCLDRIHAFRRQGKTILFVSHALTTVEQLCDRVVWLHHGEIRAEGRAVPTIQRYLEELQRHDERNREQDHRTTVIGDSDAREQPAMEITEVKLLAADRRERYSFHTGETLVVQIHYRVTDPLAEHRIDLELRRSDGLLVHRTTSMPMRLADSGTVGVAEVEFPGLPLLGDTYEILTQLRLTDARDPSDSHVCGSPCRFSIWSNLDQEGLLTLTCRWANGTSPRVMVGAAGTVSRDG